ncbi:MAG: sigma factor-like helix-turn-helix DNA-binding protein [Eubacteriales bacterium]|nr:sigma factor-like helix-turn-helix DNA-binding protein [Eubacteriales bacterium]
MKDFLEECVAGKDFFEDDSADEQKILSRALSSVLPQIIKNELTERQSICLRLFYVHGKSQTEIARELKLSQPTVSRHINSARVIVNKILGYCLYSVKKANEQWLKIEQQY